MNVIKVGLQGVFADDLSVAVSCTGTGETFMRAGVARRAAYMVEDLGLSAQEASEAALDYMENRWRLSWLKTSEVAFKIK